MTPLPQHVVAGEGTAEDMGHLARRLEPATLIGAAERGAAGPEQAARPRHATLNVSLSNSPGISRWLVVTHNADVPDSSPGVAGMFFKG